MTAFPKYAARPLSRRTVTACLLGGLVAAPAVLRAQAVTPESPLGPFYPVDFSGDTDADLTRIAGHAERAKGQVIEVVGRVLDRHGEPIRNARLKLWQANAAGRYRHPQDPAVMPLDPDFQGHANLATGADGSWRITTIKPGSYDSPIGHRPPHIHFDVSGSEVRNIMQMYFPEEAEANARDGLYARLGDQAPESVATALGDWRYRWDIVLMEG